MSSFLLSLNHIILPHICQGEFKAVVPRDLQIRLGWDNRVGLPVARGCIPLMLCWRRVAKPGGFWQYGVSSHTAQALFITLVVVYCQDSLQTHSNGMGVQ